MPPTDLPLGLYKANIDFNQRLGQLLQESGQQWLELGTRLINESIADAGAATQVAIATQATFARGLQQSLREWQDAAGLQGNPDQTAGGARRGK